MEGLPLLWLALEETCDSLTEKWITFFGDNSPLISWITRLGSWHSWVMENLIQALALCLKLQKACPLTPIYIAGEQMSLQMSHHGHLAATLPGNVNQIMNCKLFLIHCSLSPSRTPGPSTSWIVSWLVMWLPSCRRSLLSWMRVEATSKNWETHWQNWCSYIKPMGVDWYLDGTLFQTRVWCLMGYAQWVQTKFFGHGWQVQGSVVSQAIIAIGQTIALAQNVNPTKVAGSNMFLPALHVVLDGYGKTNPPTNKKLLIKTHVLELLVDLGYGKGGTPNSQAIGDLAIGKYTIKSKQQRKMFKLEDVRLFKQNKTGILTCLPNNAPLSLLLRVDSATLKSDNQKNGWKGVCMHQEANREVFKCPVQAIVRWVLHLRKNKTNG